MDFDNYEVLKTTMPSYLQDIFSSEEVVTLIFNKFNPGLKSEVEDDVEREIMQMNESTSNNDLTGNPLEIDLKDNDLCDISSSQGMEQLVNWSPEENKHYPLDLNSARSCLNILSINYKFDVDENMAPTMYCICNGDNSQQILLLGTNAKTFTRTRVMFRGCLAQRDEKLSIKHMIERHYINCDYKAAVVTNIKALYSIVGSKLGENNWRKTREGFSALLEASWNEKLYNPVAVNTASLIMQVIVGHDSSPFYANWEQLKLLNHFMLLLQDNDDLEEEVISCIPSNLNDILNHITAIIIEMQQFGNKAAKKEKKEGAESEALSLDRAKDFLDKLWEILVLCKDVNILKICFKNIFEEFANNTLIRLKISKENRTSVATILDGLLEGKLAVPNISSDEALDMLIELGLEKLKNDYCHLIVESQHGNVSKEIAKKWMDFNDQHESKIRMATTNPKGVVSRITRMTLHKGNFSKNIPTLSKKINYLSRLHVIAEFLYVAKGYCLPEHTQEIMNGVYDKFLYDKGVKLDLLAEGGLCECRVNLKRVSSATFEKARVVYWNMRLQSNHMNSGTVTIFHHTRVPIFPPVIYNDYDVITASKDDDVMYVLEAVTDIN